MAKRLSYADALKILGHNDSEVMNLAERLADGGLGLVGVPDLFGLRGALVSGGRRAVEGIRDKISGESRMSRTEKIEAAHQILVIVSFFEAVETAWEEADAPFALADLKITADEQSAMFRHILSNREFHPPLFNDDVAEGHYWDLVFGELADTFARGVTHFAVAEAHGITTPDHPFLLRMATTAAARSPHLYEEHRRLLATEVPEFGMWVHLGEHQRTRRALGTGLGELHRLLAGISSHRAADRRRQELTAFYQAVLDQPVLRSDDVPPGLALPTLEKAYVPPRGYVATTYVGSSPSTEQWWGQQPLLEDLQSFIAAHLVHPDATRRPTVILGHPGAGKSKFTEMLAAQLPSADFLPIRVELRSVQPNAPIHVQIEEGLAATLHTRVSWRELAESADGALPVIILDGFDELLQASGVDRSDYLERVQEFQHQQTALGQPVVVIVTSRTIVADRTRFPEDTTVIRLKPFSEDQIGQMVEVWNKANSRVFAARGLDPLTTDVLMRYRELAEQPLLLLMLLIYDAGDNGLRRPEEDLTHGELYERLLTMFARREVDKHHSGLTRDGFDDAVEEELRRLEIAALAMFTRRKQSVGADELDRDLAVLMPDAAVRAEDTDLHGRIDPAHQVLGRFFFVHESRARHGGASASVFEFLHATFGEYLVARAVIAALDELDASRSRSSRRRGRAAPVDDGELYALSSFASYAGREKVVDFLAELLERRFAEEPQVRADYARLLVELFQEAPFPAPNRSYTAYEPARLPLTRREANYTSNLMILLCLVRSEPIDARELFPEADEPDQALQGTTTLWRALSGSEWFSILSALRVRHLNGWRNDGPVAVTVIEREDGSPVSLGECMGFELRSNNDAIPSVIDPYDVSVPYDTVTSRLLRSMAMRVNGTAARFMFGLLPYLRHVSDDLGYWYTDGNPEVWSEAHEIMRLRLEPATEHPEQRLRTYRRLLWQRTLGRLELVALRQAAEDLALTAEASAFSTELVDIVNSYLNGVRAVVVGSQLREETVVPVLRALARHTHEEVFDRVLELVRSSWAPERELRAADGAGRIEAQAVDTVPRLPAAPAERGMYTSGG